MANYNSDSQCVRIVENISDINLEYNEYWNLEKEYDRSRLLQWS